MQAYAALFPDIPLPDFSVVAPERPVHGDYASNVAMVSVRDVHKSPMEIAQKMAAYMRSEHQETFVRIEAAYPGFLNITLSSHTIREQLSLVAANPDAWGTSDAGKGKTVVLDYFQLNIAKRPHVGHLRSAVIGDALKRMFLASGYHAVSDTHVGDWGTQFGILLLGYKEFVKKGEEKRIAEDPFDALEKLYMQENARIEASPERRDEGKREFAKLERGDGESRRIWEWMVSISMEKLHENAERLGLLPFDEHRGESFYEDKMAPIVARALEKGVAVTHKDGAVVVDLSAEGLDEAVLIKSDGATTYLLRDLATIKYRKEHWNFQKNLYVVDVRQSHHFRQLFRVAEMLGLDGAGESDHIEYGHMSLPEGPISTRKGNVVWLSKLMDEAVSKARAAIAQKNAGLADADNIARMVGIGAIKYFDLAHNRKSDIVFTWDGALTFEGNSGPYLQYTHARLRSILRKANGIEQMANSKSQSYPLSQFDPVEHELAVSILRFPEALEDGLKELSPHVLAHYLYNLAKRANEFYHSHRVLQEEDEYKRRVRIALIIAAALTLKRGLFLLGIDSPYEM